VKRSKKQYTSPEIVPSEWDRDSDEASKSEKPKTTKPVACKPTHSAPKITNDIGTARIEPPKTLTADTQTGSSAVKSKGLIKSKLNDPIPSVDPFKSKKNISKLIDKDSISHLTFKKVDRDISSSPESTLTKERSNKLAKISVNKEQVVQAPVLSDKLAEAAKTLLNGPITFNKPIERTTQKSLDNYFVPQGRTGRSISSQSTDHPQSSAISESVAQSDGSDLDIITG
jgi:hypothetical protein